MKAKDITFSELELRVILKAIMIRKFYFEDNTATAEQKSAEDMVYELIRFSAKIEPYPGI